MLTRQVLLFAAATLAGALLNALGIPIPFMLGGVVMAFVAKSFVDHEAKWPLSWRNHMLGIAGYGIGCNCTAETLVRFSEQFAGMVFATVLTIGVSVLAALWTSRHSRANLISCVLGCMPGGMTQMMLMVEEDERADANVVTVAQTLRLVLVVVSVPFLVLHIFEPATADAGAAVGGHTLTWLVLVPIAVIGQFVARRIHMPTGDLLGPVLLTAAVAVAVDPLTLEKVPSPVMAVAQLNIGLYIGTMLDRDKLLQTRAMLPHLVIGSYAMIAAGMLTSLLLTRLYGFPLLTAFLALAPGGIAEMCLAGLGMGADVDLILTYQLVRLLMLTMTVPYVIKWYFKDSEE